MQLGGRFLTLGLGVEAALGASLLKGAGDVKAIPSWDLQSSAHTGNDLAALSQTGVNTASWHHVDSPRCTLMGCLIQARVYEEGGLFHSDALKSFDANQFKIPWIYRNEFALEHEAGQHYILQTNGITSKADLFLNGKEVASNLTQAGAYAGHTYDVTKLVADQNALAVQVHPTDYNYDLALGFVDWNPYPPDNGTGVWRDIEIKQTGPVALGPLRVSLDTDFPVDYSSVGVTLKSIVQNLEDHEMSFQITGSVFDDSGDSCLDWKQPVTLGPGQSKEVVLQKTMKNPAIWWPKQWGNQPLYAMEMAVSVDGSVSDRTRRSFGIRQVTSELNSFNDTMFYVNGLPFQVIGGGYSADMFLRWDEEKFISQAKLMLDLGHNTVRLEGKNEHPELYDAADRMGLMVMAGWECCDKWESWTYNEDLSVNSKWTDKDYAIANASMYHEALMQQNHPSMLAYLVGSDYWPDDRATQLYLSALNATDWQVPVIASASKRSYPEALGPSGLKMDGPYDWVPPNYWYNVEPAEDRLGAAFGFGSELGAGVGTPELSSLKKFLSDADMEDLWKKPDKGLYHMSTNVSSFYDRKIYNDALWKRLGAPTSLEDYLMKAQIMDYEATKAQFEAVSAFWNADRPATGLIYWMLNNAWPSLHWNLFDYYLHPAGSYFGAKVGARTEHVAYDYLKKAVYLINHSRNEKGSRTLAVDMIDTDGKSLYKKSVTIATEPNKSKKVLDLATSQQSLPDVAFLRLELRDGKRTVSRNVYWLSKTIDTLGWEDSDWFFTPVTKYADYTGLNKLQTAKVKATVALGEAKAGTTVVLENQSSLPAFFIRLNLVDSKGEDVLPVFWSDNYVTLWPNEKLELQVEGQGAAAVQIDGKNIKKAEVQVG
ncbi:glycoside hydrolase family 2 protein [Xylariomycetidae sp. FL0641]|nr:glycoside hydrolase family 2 protein [Xylariomycetidae sp. FL0641]